MGLDYPQFPVVAGGAYLFVPLALRDQVVALDLRPDRAFERQPCPEQGLIVTATGGTWSPLAHRHSHTHAHPHPSTPSLTGDVGRVAPSLTLEVHVSDTPLTGTHALRGALSVTSADGRVSIWIKIPANLVTVYKGELPYNDGFHPGPGRYELPSARCTVRGDGSAQGGASASCATSVTVLHEHAGARWPMIVYNGSDFDGRWAGRLFPSTQFRSAPTYYLVFVQVMPVSDGSLL